jgi:thiol-disulfide isomerase/thioredoxin
MRTILLSTLCAVSLFAAGELSNRRAPSFSLPDSQGRQYDILDFRGKVLIVDFMRTNCPHCAAMSAVLEEVKQKYGDKLAVLSVVNFPDDGPQTVAQYIAGNKVTTPILFDCGTTAVAYMRATSFETPHVFLIDSKGTIRNDFSYSPMTREMFEGKALSAVVEKLLGEAAAAPAKKK